VTARTVVSPPAADVECGLLAYSTQGGRLKGSLRKSLEDFQVEEIISIKEMTENKAPGLVPIYKVTKAGIDTPHVAHELADKIRGEVNFAGLKDKNATVVQYLSARSARASSPAAVTGSKFKAGLVGFSKPITRANLVGNRFRITVESSVDLTEDTEMCFKACRERRIGNFFGYQRFGLRGGVNRRVGRAMISKEFAQATDLLLAEPRGGEDGRINEARRLCREGRHGDALPLFSRAQDIERRVANHLSLKLADHLGALRRIPIRIRRLLVNGYQAFLFNLTLSRAMADGLDISAARIGDNWATLREDGLNPGKVHGVRESLPEGGFHIPLVQVAGYAFRDYGSRFDSRLVEVLKEEGVDGKSFYVKEMEEVSCEGGFRAAPLLASNLSFRKDGTRSELEFSLGKGEYATVLLRELLKPEDPLAEGF